MQASDDAYFMGLALEQARLGAAAGEVPVGAVLVQRGPEQGVSGARVLAAAHNRPIGLHDPSAHAEMLALRQAAQVLQNYRLDDCELYVTLEPCPMCAQAALHSRLRRVVYGAREPKSGAAGSVLDLFAYPALNHRTVVHGGVRAEECAALLEDFFAQRRLAVKRAHTPLRPDALRTPAAAFEPLWQAFAHWQVYSHTWQDWPELEGLRLHALDLAAKPQVTPESTTATLLLHGPEAWWPQWAGWLEQRHSTSQRWLVPDLIGFGQSDKPKQAAWHTLERHAVILLALCDAVGVQRLQLVYAPGQAQLAQALQQRAGPRLLGLAECSPPQSPLLTNDWSKLPCPDAGHRAAQRAWRERGWT
ncbi:MAG: tRNA adenosine(34) deaminase TadA [Serpentinimonas sp.]|nr:tRNA adenosine(34) deaminase TadA [Serpentinimonas sp.]